MTTYILLIKVRSYQWGSQKSKKCNSQKTRKKGQAMIYKTLHRILNIDQHESHYNAGVNSCASKYLSVPAQLMTPVALL